MVVASALLLAFKRRMSAAVVLPALILAVVTARALERLRGVGAPTRWLLASAASPGPTAGCAGALGAAYFDQRATAEPAAPPP